MIWLNARTQQSPREGPGKVRLEMKMKSLLTPKDRESELPDLGRSTIYALLKAGTIPSIRLGKKIFTPRAALEKWIATCCEPNHTTFFELPNR